MDHKLELELRGEKTANYLRLFLLIAFSLGTVLAYLQKSKSVTHDRSGLGARKDMLRTPAGWAKGA